MTTPPHHRETEKLIRTVGFWGLVAMCINAVVGSGVFFLPTESYRLLGAFSLWAPLLFAVPVFILVLCFAEASSHFSEPGGAYLYARTAFGDFIGFETGWMNWVARLTSLASLSNGFVLALAFFFPGLKEPIPRAIVITLSIVILAVIHILAVRYGAASIYVFTRGKLIPLIGFIGVSLFAFKFHPIPPSLHLPLPRPESRPPALRAPEVPHADGGHHRPRHGRAGVRTDRLVRQARAAVGGGTPDDLPLHLRRRAVAAQAQCGRLPYARTGRADPRRARFASARCDPHARQAHRGW